MNKKEQALKDIEETQKKLADLQEFVEGLDRERTYSYGDYFYVSGELNQLAQVDVKKCCFIGRDGNRYANPVAVLDLRNITRIELEAMSGGEWEYVGEVDIIVKGEL